MPNGEHPEDINSNYMVIPYFPGDRGRPTIERPLATPAVYYACPSIVVLVDGAPSIPVFTPGGYLEIRVTVANYGGGTINAPATVAVWWADPNTAFTTANWFGQASVVVPTRGGVKETPIIRNRIPPTAPSHICLLARVTAPGDKPLPGDPIDPVGDRHWAQLNLNAVALSQGSNFQFTFWAGNPLSEPAAFDLIAQPVTGQSLEMLARQLRAEPVDFGEIALDLIPVGADEPHGSRMTVELEANARQQIDVHGTLPHELERSRFTAVEILQVQRGDEQQRIVGSLGVVMGLE